MAYDDAKLKRALDRANEYVRNMSPQELAEMRAAQQASFVRSMRPCEHGVRDFEGCPDCRAASARGKP